MATDGIDDAVGRTPAAYEPGDRINGRYVVNEALGSGAFARVYRVHDEYTDGDFALKVLSPDSDVEAVRREWRAHAGRLHPNIADVVFLDRTHTRPESWILVQELVDGYSLSDLCAPTAPLDDTDALEAVDQVLKALKSIHPDEERIAELEAKGEGGELSLAEHHELMDLKRTGLVHRDVKPQNIRRRDDGVVKLLDFGIATVAGSTVHTQTATPEYVPPDADLFRWEPTYDLFAVGVIAFELLARTSPFEGGLPALGRRVRLSDCRKDLPAAVVDFVERAIAEDARERFGTATEMLESLDAAMGDLTEPAEDPSSTNSVAAAAAVIGMEAEYRRALAVAGRHGLGARHYKKSLMLTPPSNRSRYLVNLGFDADRGLLVACSGYNWQTFYGLSDGDLTAELVKPGTTTMSAERLGDLLDRLDDLLERADVTEWDRSAGTVPIQVIVEHLLANDGDHTIDGIAEATGVARGIVRRRLSDLTTGSCSESYRGLVRTTGRGRYAAVDRRIETAGAPE